MSKLSDWYDHVVCRGEVPQPSNLCKGCRWVSSLRGGGYACTRGKDLRKGMPHCCDMYQNTIFPKRKGGA